MSVASETWGYDTVCCLSHEFLRRACTRTPMRVSWAGDLLLYNDIILKQSEVNDMRGGDCETKITYGKPNISCSDAETGIPGQYKVESTDIREGKKNSFEYFIPKNVNPENEHNWTLLQLESTDDCGKMHDIGDVLQQYYMLRGVISLCGTIDRSSGAFDAQAHYLDNRKSYSDDPDNGLLVCIRTGAVWNWEIRYAPKELLLNAGLSVSDDITLAFREALEKEGMTDADVFEFGMI